MNESEIALIGTEFLSPARHTAFYDRYRIQYTQTIAWLQGALVQSAATRDRQRRTDRAWLADKRRLLGQFSGASQLRGEVRQVERWSISGGATAYRAETGAGLLYTGLFWEPAAEVAHGMVILAGVNEAEQDALVADYLAQGLRVILPCLARTQHSFTDHPDRRWCFFTDDELLHLLFFIVGGSLAGLEAAEVLTITAALAQDEGEILPVALHMAGRHTLTAVVAAALGSDWGQHYSLLVLPQEVSLLDQQEADLRVNTIWNFHTHFDGLTLFALASDTNLLFIEESATPSALYARASAWFASQSESAGWEQRVERLVAPTSAELAKRVIGRLSASSVQVVAGPRVVVDQPTLDYLYRQVLETKIAYLEALHRQASQHRQQRYDLTSLTPDQYRQRVAESVERVAGPALPETVERRPQTRRIQRRPTYDLYEITLESTPGVRVAGYLLLPINAAPVPAVICQHGLGGRPDALVGFEDRFEGQWVYDRFAQRLAEKGYVVFVPFMNWGWPTVADRDRLVKASYALGMAPNRFEVAQLHAIVDFLQARPEVLSDRIAFYGLSYGGHASLWLCAHEPRLAAVVTAGHFNEWQSKLTSTELSPPLVRPTSYLTVDEGYDMFNYNILNELGHAELVTRFAPRPHFIENGLQDNVTPTAWVNREFARVEAVFRWLNAPNQVVLEHFPGPHRVWAEGSFAFLQRYLL